MKKKIRIGSVVVILVLFAVAMVQNRASVQVNFLMWSPRLPMIVVLLLSVIVGFVCGVLFAAIRARKRR